jgi:hypothetical protein
MTRLPRFTLVLLVAPMLAFACGGKTSTVRVLMTRAATKLGARSRHELLAKAATALARFS